MSIRDWFRRPALRGVAVASRRVREGTVAGTSDSPEDMVGWTKLGGEGSRELDESDLERIRKRAVATYIQNPYAHRAVEHMVGYVVGPGFQVRSWSEKFNAILQEHWEDPDNNWDLRQYEIVKDLSVFGELFPRAFVGDKTGRVKWAYVDPGRVKRVVVAEENAEQVREVVLKRRNDEKAEKRLDAILPNEKKKNAPLEGDVFAFRINEVKGQTRGLGDLTAALDWFDLGDDFAFTASERAKLQQNIAWDFVVPGISQQEAEKLIKTLEPPDRNSVQVTSDKDAGWQPKVPDIKAMDLKAMDDLILRRLEAGTGFPRHWFGEGTDVNRAVGAVMGAPVFRMVMRRQRFVKYLMERMFDFVLSKAIEAGAVKAMEVDPATGEKREVDFEVVCPEITFEDQSPRTQALFTLIQSLSLAMVDGALSAEQYRTILLHQLDKDGFDLPEETPDAPEAEIVPAPIPGDVMAGLRALAASANGNRGELMEAIEAEARRLRTHRSTP